MCRMLRMKMNLQYEFKAFVYSFASSHKTEIINVWSRNQGKWKWDKSALICFDVFWVVVFLAFIIKHAVMYNFKRFTYFKSCMTRYTVAMSVFIYAYLSNDKRWNAFFLFWAFATKWHVMTHDANQSQNRW